MTDNGSTGDLLSTQPTKWMVHWDLYQCSQWPVQWGAWQLRWRFHGMIQLSTKCSLYLSATVACGLIKFANQFTKSPAFGNWRVLISEPIATSLTPGVDQSQLNRERKTCCVTTKCYVRREKQWRYFQHCSVWRGNVNKTDCRRTIGLWSEQVGRH